MIQFPEANRSEAMGLETLSAMRKRHVRECLDLVRAAIRKAGSIPGGAMLIGMDRAQMHRELRKAGLSRTEILEGLNRERP